MGNVKHKTLFSPQSTIALCFSNIFFFLLENMIFFFLLEKMNLEPREKGETCESTSSIHTREPVT